MPTVRELMEKQASYAAPRRQAAPQGVDGFTKQAAEELLQTAGIGPIKIAQIAGDIRACGEYKFSYEEASEYLQLPVNIIKAVEKAAFSS